jgi:hypothetical protein
MLLSFSELQWQVDPLELIEATEKLDEGVDVAELTRNPTSWSTLRRTTAGYNRRNRFTIEVRDELKGCLLGNI